MKHYRIKNGYTQKELANLLDMPYRTYQNYEEEKNSMPNWLEELILFKLASIQKYAPDRGIYKVKQIKYVSIPIFLRYRINFVYLGGDYIKEPLETSNLEFLVNGDLPMAVQFKLVEELEKEFSKNIILNFMSDFDRDSEFIGNILKKGKVILDIENQEKKK